MREAVIVDGVRTPIGRAHPQRGWLRTLRPDDMMVALIHALIERNRLDPELIEEVVIGCANQSGVQGGPGLARIVTLLAGLPYNVAAQTTERQCASAMTAIHYATMAIREGMGDIMIAGGVESMSMVPMGANAIVNPKLALSFSIADLPMGATAEKVANKHKISRKEQDSYGLESHRKTAAACAKGLFKDEIIPLEVTYEDGSTALISKDQSPRENVSIEVMAELKPAFRPGGTVTAGNSSPINDGASAALIMTKEKAKQLGLTPLATIRWMAVAGVDPTEMGLGPIPATKKCLERSGLTIDDMDLIEINEAFASQTIHCIRELHMDMKKVNVNGGAIALGHPLGSTGCRIVVSLAHEMKRRNARYGLATLCVGFGQGAATIIEREEY